MNDCSYVHASCEPVPESSGPGFAGVANRQELQFKTNGAFGAEFKTAKEASSKPGGPISRTTVGFELAVLAVVNWRGSAQRDASAALTLS